ncbi:hypothetical protein BH24GEM3_BH24GEM3_07690 [soil metagenome]
MLLGVHFESAQVANRTVDINSRHLILFGYQVAENRDSAAMKEVEDSVIDVAVPHAEFVDVIPQVIRFKPTQLVSQLS